MSSNVPSLKANEEAFALRMAAGDSVEEASVAAGVTRRHGSRFLLKPEVLEAIRVTREALRRRTFGKLEAASVRAAVTLEQLLDPGLEEPADQRKETPPAVRVQAAKAILEARGKLRQELETDERLRVVEAALGIGRPVSATPVETPA